MNRRESLKIFGIGTLSTGVLIEACNQKKTEPQVAADTDLKNLGRQNFEIARDKTLDAETFFNEHEMATITVLADIIIPKDEKSGNASDAHVPAFIEFIVKDEPEHQLPMRGGLRWLDIQCLNRYNNEFKSCTTAQQLEIVNDIAFPFKPKPGLEQGVTFFNKMRELTAIGFFTSQMGIKDLGYMGNAPGKWEGVPLEVLKQYGLEEV
jgi:gluconate 2-dehydrogenase gamma chain